MYGSTIGNLCAIIYILYFQICGIFIADFLLNKEKKLLKLLIGSVFGSFLLMWLPVITSMFMGFNMASHIIALLLLLLIVVGVVCYKRKKKSVVKLMVFDIKLRPILVTLRNNWFFMLLFAILGVFYALLLNNHVLGFSEFGVYTGQCTFGDMNMHLGFITSIANQGTFPPEYSIMPGNALCYPFLCDSVSSSLYIFGSSLRLAYCLPMMIAFLQVMGGFYAFVNVWLKDRAKTVVSFILFFFNGGLGILYFTEDLVKLCEAKNWDFALKILNWIIEHVGNVSISMNELMTGFYNTPTNLNNSEYPLNIRWVNVIADMLLPQRATLFGWSILFTVLFLLWKAHFDDEKGYFYIAGVLAGGLVMIHTHSFLSLGIVCAVWLLFYLIELTDIRLNINKYIVFFIRCLWLTLSILFMYMLREYDLQHSMVKDLSKLWFAIGITGVAVLAIAIVLLLLILWHKGKIMPVIKTWGAFLAVVLPLALFQLVTWTFKQAKGDRFVRGQFNWANIDDSYISFYIKNIGIILFVILIALVFAKKKMFRLAMSGIAIWFIAEFLGFQPNAYDNNKILYVGFLFLIVPAASLLVELFRKIKIRPIGYILLTLFLCFYSISGVLTLAREYLSGYNEYDKEVIAANKYIDSENNEVYVSGYQLYANEYLGIVDYINSSDIIAADAVVLTSNNHNNAIASLTGRNIVVGTSSFLYYHGFDTTEREANVRMMFEYPEYSLSLFEKYNVEYVVIGSSERYSYNIDDSWFAENAILLYQRDGGLLYKLDY